MICCEPGGVRRFVVFPSRVTIKIITTTTIIIIIIIIIFFNLIITIITLLNSSQNTKYKFNVTIVKKEFSVDCGF